MVQLDGKLSPQANEFIPQHTNTTKHTNVSPSIPDTHNLSLEYEKPSEHKFIAIRRPNLGTEGKKIHLKANHLKVSINDGYVYQYKISISPAGCPMKVNRQVVKTMIEAHSQIWRNSSGLLLPVYDGKEWIFTKEEISYIGSETYKFTVDIPGWDGNDRTFTIQCKFEKKISLYNLVGSNGVSRDVPDETLYAVDVVLRHLHTMSYKPVGRSFFSAPTGNYRPLGGGREVWFGFHQAVCPSFWSMTLNIDVSATAFYKEQSVIDFICEILEISDIPQVLNEHQRSKVMKELKGLQVEVTHSSYARKYRVLNVTKKSASMQTFPMESDDGLIEERTVQHFFRKKYNLKLRHPLLPCLQVGKETRQTYLPLEVCKIVSGQRCLKKLTDNQTSTMIRVTARSAPNREQEIKNLITKANINNDPSVAHFGLHVSNKMIDSYGRVLDPPTLEYGTNHYSHRRTFTSPSEGVWDMRGKRLYFGVSVHCWSLICYTPKQSLPMEDLNNFMERFMHISDSLGMRILNKPEKCQYLHGLESVKSFFEYVHTHYKQEMQLIIVVLPGKTPIYAEVKRMGDIEFGMATQCIKDKNVKKPTSQMISNLVLKINAKLGGINTILQPEKRLELFKEPVVFMGATVTHPTSKDTRKSSIASMACSMDAHPSIYSAVVRIQEARSDIITSMTDMVHESLLNFYDKTGFKPHRIFMYRDGVSEGQFDNVLQVELLAIRKACLKLNKEYTPGITLIVVQKRHHTRLFCGDSEDQSGRSGNIPAGTIVDHTITNPSAHDFYLCSHQGIQGTSRPTYYRCLWDDSKLTGDQLQSLTYHLCYTHVRCTRSVSIPAPAYYAHLVVMRCRHHLTEKDTSLDMTLSVGEGEEAIKVHKINEDKMYFT